MTTEVYAVNVMIHVNVLGFVPVRADSASAAGFKVRKALEAIRDDPNAEEDLNQAVNQYFDLYEFTFPGSIEHLEACEDGSECGVTPQDLAEAFNKGDLCYGNTPFITKASFRRLMSETGKKADHVQADEDDD